MEKFIQDRSNLNSYSGLKFISRAQRPYISIDHPEILAGFAGYLKVQCLKNNSNTKVFCRGQRNDYASIPSLFRGAQLTENRLQQRLEAYNSLVSRTKTLFNASRFQKENINPIFQHYGIKTPWLDLVDNIFIAIWFATNIFFDENKGKPAHYKTSDQQDGHLYFYQTSAETEYFDLREGHFSLSLRLHAQHGISMTQKNDPWTLSNRSLDEHIVATVKIPNILEWRLSGEIFSSKFLFPSPDLDNTYKYLKKGKFKELLCKIQEEYSLEKDELGNITNFG